MQHRLEAGKLLDEKGNLQEAGYAFSLVKEYQRKDIKAAKFRIKEWDYYYFGNDEYGVALTIDDNSYMSLVSVSFLDFKIGRQVTKSPMGFMPLGKVGFPPSSVKGDVTLEGKGYSFSFLNDGKKRHLIVRLDNFEDEDGFECDLTVTSQNVDSMVIATPFKKDRHFYYNQKINNLEANGTIKIGRVRYPVSGWQGVLDWGRGVWTYKNTWYWASLSGISDGHLVGFNLGYGFGDTTAASENMLFYDTKGYKMNDVVFDIPKGKNGKEKYMEKWDFHSSDDTIKMTFTPVLDRYDNSNVLLISSLQHQVFGYFDGYFLVPKIGRVKISHVLGFAEKVVNKW